MRKLLLFLALSPLAWGQAALIAHSVGNSSTAATTAPVNIAGANFVAIGIGFNSAPSTVTDSLGNTASQCGTNHGNDSTGATTGIWYIKNVIGGGAGYTVTANGAQQDTITMQAWSGMSTTNPCANTTPGTGVNGAVLNTSSTTFQPGAVTPGTAGDIVIEVISTGTAASWTINSGFAITDQMGVVGGTSYGAALAWLSPNNTSAINPTWTANGSGSAPLAAATFKFSPTPFYSLTGPLQGRGVSTNFTVALTTCAVPFNGSQTVTIGDGTQGGTITPSVGSPGVSTVTVTPVNGACGFTFTYTPVLYSTVTITGTNGQSWLDPTALSYTNGYTCQASNSTAWATNSTWTSCGGSTPVNGDKANIPDTKTVTISTNETLGTSGVAATVDLTLNASGALVIASGGTLHMRGSVRVTGSGGGPGPTQLTVQGGGTWEWDASQAASPSTAIYTYSALSAFQYTSINFSGSSGFHATIRSNAAGANGRFVAFSNTTPALTALYADFLRIGDATHSALDVNLVDSTVLYSASHSTFTSCGYIAYTGGAGVPANGTFIHDYNIHASSLGGEIFHNWFTDNATVGTGTREIKNNVMDVGLSTSVFQSGGLTITGNYMGDQLSASSSSGAAFTWASWRNNFMRYTSAPATGTYGDMVDGYLFLDADTGNAHVLQNGCFNLVGIIFGQAGTGTTGINDSGELYYLSNASASATCGVYNSIILPNMAGYSSLEIGSLLVANPNTRASVEHNTWFGGWNRGATTSGAIGALQLGEGGSGLGVAGSVRSFRGNLLWNPELASYLSSFLLIADISGSATPTLDYCVSATACDYNGKWNNNTSSTGTNAAALTPAANLLAGYGVKTTSAVGQHDVSGNPGFADYVRNVELFDSKYLGNSPAAWVSGNALVVGDMRSYSVATVYWANSLNYRYKNTGTCGSSLTTAPGMATTQSRDCWEWASLYDLRQAVGAGTTYTDPSIGAVAADALTTLTLWIRAGYTLTNAAFCNSAHDGRTMGAVSCGGNQPAGVYSGTAMAGKAIVSGKVVQ